MSLIHFPLRVSDDAEIVEADGSVLGHVVWHDNSPRGQWKQNTDARAAEIVRRCNAHDELVSALRDLLADYESEINSEWSGTRSHKAMLAKADPARAALAKAEAR